MEDTYCNAPILIVDDDESIREVMSEVLRYEGYVTATAASGAEALEYLHHNPPPRLILLDLMMPGMTGVEFVDEQQRDPEIADIPVMMVSANMDLDETARSHHTPFLRKPMNVETLLDAIEHPSEHV